MSLAKGPSPMAYASARSIALSEIPVIDIAPLRDGSDPGTVARQILQAATEIGFLYVSNHGIPGALIERARAAALRFFALPPERKAEVTVNAHHRGFLQAGQAKMHDGAKPDLKESYIWGLELSPEELATIPDHPFLGPNNWPVFMPELKDAIYPYFEAAHGCAAELLTAFALALDLTPDALLKTADRPISRASLTYYPPQPAELGCDRFGVAPHTDFGVLTVLCQDDVGGLQVQNLAGDWLTAHPIPGTLVVNVGDLLARWSNDRFRSTPHRVVNASGRDRISLVVAFDPNAETMIDPAIACTPGQKPHYAPIRCGDYLQWRFKKAFAYRQ